VYISGYNKNILQSKIRNQSKSGSKEYRTSNRLITNIEVFLNDNKQSEAKTNYKLKAHYERKTAYRGFFVKFEVK